MSLATGDSSEGNKQGGDNNTQDEASGGAGSLSGLFNAGADEPLNISLNPDTSGLPTLFSHGQQVSYAVNGNVLTASVGVTTVFTLQVNPDGSWSFDLKDQLDHVNDGTNSENLALVTSGGSVLAIDFSSIITATDADGDEVAGAAQGAFTIAVQDDIPEAHIGLWPLAFVAHDETPGDQFLSNDTASPAVVSLFSSVSNPGDDLDVPGAVIGYAHSLAPVVFGLSSVGADDPAVSKAFSLNISNTDSGLTTTEGKHITLSLEGDLVVGRVVGADANDPQNGVAAFAIHIDANGHISVAQYLSLHHDGINAPLDSVSLSGKIEAVLTVVDNDGDTVSDRVDIGGRVVFLDDDPKADNNLTVRLDDDDLTPNGNHNSSAGDDPAPLNTIGVLAHNYGSDGPGSLLLTAGAPLPSGFTATVDATGKVLTINQGATAVLQVTLTDQTSGAYTVTQLAPINHPTQNGTINDNTENNLEFTINYVVKDGDGDTTNGSLKINVDDDIPVISVPSTYGPELIVNGSFEDHGNIGTSAGWGIGFAIPGWTAADPARPVRAMTFRSRSRVNGAGATPGRRRQHPGGTRFRYPGA